MVIKFSVRIYKLSVVKSAIKAYRGLADFSIKEKKDYFEVGLENIDKEVKDIIQDEFCNYVLALMKA